MGPHPHTRLPCPPSPPPLLTSLHRAVLLLVSLFTLLVTSLLPASIFGLQSCPKALAAEPATQSLDTMPSTEDAPRGSHDSGFLVSTASE
ncbi:hypothetical protein HDU96_002858, partial [Phlyctochytrium bullatum]